MDEPAAAAGAGEPARALAQLGARSLGESKDPPPPLAVFGGEERSFGGGEGAATERGAVSSRALRGGDSLSGPIDVERARVKLEAARARLSGPWSEIPVGRVYDSPPDSTDEKEYDALEKAYNQAFLATSASQFDQSRRPDQPAEAGGGSTNGLASALHAGLVDCSASGLAGAAPSVPSPSLPSPSLQDAQSAPTQAAKYGDSHTAEASGDDVYTREGQPMTNGETETSRTTEDEAQAEAKAPMARCLASSPTQNENIGHAGSTTTPTTPPEAKDPVVHGNAATIDPNLEQKVSTEGAVIGVARGGENQALNEFLVAELQFFVGRLFGHDMRTSTPADHDIAHVTSLQLFHNHQRALMDFIADSKRYELWTKPSLSSTSAPAAGSALVEPPAVLCQNPFQSTSTQPDRARWSALLENVRPLSRPHDERASATPPLCETNPLFMRALQFHEGGLNAVTLKRGDGDRERRSVAVFLTQVAKAVTTSGLHLVVCARSDLHVWQEALRLNEELQVYPYWEARDDRKQSVERLKEQYARGRPKTQVVLASLDSFTEDSDMLSLLPFQLVVVDMPDTQHERAEAKWPCILSQRCRQRILMCSEDLDIDARRALHFILPGLFSSRRKFLAWNYAALDASQIQAVCGAIATFSILSEDDAVRRFVGRLAAVTQESSEQELAMLGRMHKQAAARPVVPLLKIQTKPGVLKKPLNRTSSSTPTKKAVIAEKKNDPKLPSNTPKSSQSLNISLKKRRGSGSGRHSRKRISRCGKCSGCLSEDCMVCGHCKDMKKYGGPGLRKQSCKNRKCLNPKSWGLSSKRRKRSKHASGMAGSANDEAEGVAISTHEDSDMYDDMAASYSSMDSDRESVPSSLRHSTRSGADSDSDGGGFSRLSDDGSVDSPRSINLLLPASDTLFDENLSLSDLSSRSSSRSRVVRCGKCAGCTAQDCMTCRHCLDMKKYGGPGLRKQSCKNRKCTMPKVVELGQGDEDDYIDETGSVVSAELLEAPDPSDRSDLTSPEAAIAAPVEDRSGFLSVVQHCAVFVEPRLVFQCAVCTARFCSKPFLDFHKRVEHSQPPKADDAEAPAAFALDRQASRLFLHPITQNAIVAAQLRQQGRTQRACPLGYAKLEGADFQYFFIEPYVVLGRLEPYWRELYKDLGVRDLKGLPGGAVDCHLGNDRSIAEQHALISWDGQRGQFAISCLSARSPVTVDGQDVGFAAPPVPVRSRALVQIGASTFHFLLPRAEPGAAVPRAPRQPRASREDVRAWVHAAVEKRRAKKRPQQSAP